MFHFKPASEEEDLRSTVTEDQKENSKEDSENNEPKEDTKDGENKPTNGETETNSGETEETNEESTTEDNLYTEISGITGINIEGEFSEDSIGYSEYVKKVYSKGQDDFQNIVKEKYPTSYAVLMHEINGGDPSALLQTAKGKLNEVDNDGNASIVASNVLKSRGIDDESISLIVKSKQESGNLVDYANTLVKENNQNIDNEQKKIIEEQELAKKEYDKIVNNHIENISNFVKKGIFEGSNGQKTVILEKDKQEFLNYLSQHLSVNADGSLVGTINISDLKELQYLFIAHKKGDLSSIVTNKAKDINAKRIKKLGSKAKKEENNVSMIDAIRSMRKNNK